MGWFDDDREVYVASVAYNLAGDPADRPDFLKTVVIESVLSGNDSIGSTLNGNYLSGPGIKLRSFFRWADLHYDIIGMPEATLSNSGNVDTDVLQDNIPGTPPDASVWVQTADAGQANYMAWVHQWFYVNKPDLLNTAWNADIIDGVIAIIQEDGTIDTFLPADFDQSANYIVAQYVFLFDETEDPIVTGPVTDLGETEDFPDDTGWDDEGVVVNPTSYVLVTRTTVDVDGDVTVTEDTTTEDRDTETQTFTKETYEGSVDPLAPGLKTVHEWMFWIKSWEVVVETTITEETVDGITTTTMVEQDVLVPSNSWRIDSQNTFSGRQSEPQIFIYRIGSGNAELDASYQEVANFGKFYPTIPIRLDNKFIEEVYSDEEVTQMEKAYKKATSSKMSKLIDTLEDNDKLTDIDFAFVTFGVSLNVQDNSSRKYIYRFFKKLMENQVGDATSFTAQAHKAAIEAVYQQKYNLWLTAQSEPTDPLYGTPAPVRATEPPVGLSDPEVILGLFGNMFGGIFARNTISLKNSGPKHLPYEPKLVWNLISETVAPGLGRAGARKGDTWVVAADHGAIRVYFQDELNQYRYLHVIGMKYINPVYEGKTVTITAAEAVADEDESGFIIPVHYGTFRELSLVDSTQMSTACFMLVLNCYEVVVTRWYEKWIFKLIMVIVIAGIVGWATGGTAIGLLGPALSVGTSLGFTGVTAAIVGSIANALAAMILVTIIEKAAVFLFGEKLGLIIAIAASFLATNMISNWSMTGSLSINWGDMMRVDNLMKLTSAVGDGVAGWIQADTKDVYKEMQAYIEQNQKEIAKIKRKAYEEFGGRAYIDAMMLTDSSGEFVNESRNSFVSRTLLTGSEIAQMSMDMVSGFADMTLALPDDVV